jgi:hypothetical protein
MFGVSIDDPVYPRSPKPRSATGAERHVRVKERAVPLVSETCVCTSSYGVQRASSSENLSTNLTDAGHPHFDVRVCGIALTVRNNQPDVWLCGCSMWEQAREPEEGSEGQRHGASRSSLKGNSNASVARRCDWPTVYVLDRVLQPVGALESHTTKQVDKTTDHHEKGLQTNKQTNKRSHRGHECVQRISSYKK